MKFELLFDSKVEHGSNWHLMKPDGEGGGIKEDELIEFIKAEDKEKWFYEWL